MWRECHDWHNLSLVDQQSELLVSFFFFSWIQGVQQDAQLAVLGLRVNRVEICMDMQSKYDCVLSLASKP